MSEAQGVLAAVIQTNSGNDRVHNLMRAEQLLEEAATAGAKLLVLPENFSFFGADEKEKLAHQEDPQHGPSLRMVQAFAQRHGAWVVAGSIPTDVGESQRVANSSFVVNDQGQVVARYDKIHLFDVTLNGGEGYRESDMIRAGSQPVVVDSPFGRIGLSICYDLRFPELYRALTDAGAEIFTVPAAFTLTTGQVHWELLLRARAVENFCHLLAPNQWGRHPGNRKTYGSSMIVEPWGSVVARVADGEGYALAPLDPARVARCRSQIPCLQHRVLSF
ncbi:Nitrilase/cyanide hydratase and apolipoprotein N-acyltransferase [Magnetococcus marinus MC-1]|uniref:Nitrilase/cyanide hydratase and apolipoprotein N-acyltransferase n=1 Tax=Magnetococcus marinus (strain ATCC BAA-1437 / JCM 17883 / MC-1) TaxID=156889 RepID=A0L7H1_MAGMM|nr:carbon-nitrogen hydrolase family protein [Magnetococcus marinus]ABK43914.1 Nitrilase/cyanide hydratase and apolipoprotein N-acyltransferase [Magnetococcus marinus MC-1]